MKKKLTAIALVVALLAVAVIGGTLAYFTDTDSAKNTFTVGNVKIDLIEQEKTEQGLVGFEQNKLLVPGKSNDGNAVSKIVTVKNTGRNENAWNSKRIAERNTVYLSGTGNWNAKCCME